MTTPKQIDPTINVKEMIDSSVRRIDDLRELEVLRLNEKIDAADKKYQIQFNDSKEAVVAALTATKEAINKADQANEKRFDSVNEFRSTLADQQTKLLTRTEYESNHQALIEKIDGVTDRINRTEGSVGIYVTHTDLNVAMDKLQSSIESTLRPVVAFMNAQKGGKEGVSSVWGYIVGAVGIASAVVAILMSITGK